MIEWCQSNYSHYEDFCAVASHGCWMAIPVGSIRSRYINSAVFINVITILTVNRLKTDFILSRDSDSLPLLFTGNCIYNYTEQPPASLNCTLEDELQLRCTATGPRGSTLSIEWFRDSMPLLQSNSDVSIQETPTEGRVVSILTQQQLDNNLGFYYCQLSVNGNTSQTFPSDSFELTGSQVNTGGMECPTGPQFKAEAKCAGLSMTVLPTPSLTATYTSQLFMTSTTQLPSPTDELPSPSIVSLATNQFSTPPTSDTVTNGSINTSGGSVAVYVVVAIVAVLVITLSFLIIRVGLCLRKSKTGMETQKGYTKAH